MFALIEYGQCSHVDNTAVNVSEADFYHLVELRNHVRGESFDTKSSNDLFVAALNDILTRVLKAQIAGGLLLRSIQPSQDLQAIDQNDSANGADIDHLVKLKMDAEFEDLGAMSTPFFDQAFEKAFPRAIEIMTKASPIETLLKDIVELRDRAMEMIGFSASKLPKLHLSEGLESQFACAIDTALEADIANIFGGESLLFQDATHSDDQIQKTTRIPPLLVAMMIKSLQQTRIRKPSKIRPRLLPMPKPKLSKPRRLHIIQESMSLPMTRRYKMRNCRLPKVQKSMSLRKLQHQQSKNCIPHRIYQQTPQALKNRRLP